MHVAHSDAMLKVLQQRVDAWMISGARYAC